MKYRLLEIADLYREYINQLGNRGNDLSYNELHRRVLDDCYSESDYIHKYLQGDYGIETMHIYYNYDLLQRKWDNNPDKDPFSILLRQIKQFNPDVILVLNLWFLSVEKINIIRETLHNQVRFICYHFTGIDDFVKKVFPEYDFVMTGSEYWAKVTKRYAEKVYVVRHAFEPSILKKLKTKESVNKPGFAGSIILGNRVHNNRVDIISALKKNIIEFDYYGRIYGSFFKPRNILEGIKKPIKYIERINTGLYIKKICQPSVFGLAYYNTLRYYSININIHAEAAASGAGNQRMFEVTGVGSCLITDYREENSELFDIEKEIVVYKNEDELVDKLQYLLKHEEEARKIAERGQQRTLNEHNYRNKASIIHKYIEEIL